MLWAIYGAFALFALFTNTDATTFQFNGPLGAIKALVWIALLAFLAFSIHCSLRENFFRSAKSLISLYWGRQVTLDLYLGLLITLLLVYLNEGLLAVLIWLIPTLLFANLVTLLYLAIHFDAIVGKFLGT